MTATVQSRNDRRIINQAIQALFNPLFKRFDDAAAMQKEKLLLAHYTSIQILEKMLLNRQIWLENPLFVNDHDEMRFGMRGWNALGSLCERRS